MAGRLRQVLPQQPGEGERLGRLPVSRFFQSLACVHCGDKSTSIQVLCLSHRMAAMVLSPTCGKLGGPQSPGVKGPCTTEQERRG